MIRFVLSVISVNLYNDQTRCFVDRMGKYFSSLLGAVLQKDKLDVCPPYIADALSYLKGKLE